jgi:hypothetical protein
MRDIFGKRFVTMGDFFWQVLRDVQSVFDIVITLFDILIP